MKHQCQELYEKSTSLIKKITQLTASVEHYLDSKTPIISHLSSAYPTAQKESK